MSGAVGVTFRTPPHDRLWSCPHCTESRGTCCQCDGTRQVTPEIAAINLSNVWEFKDCTCSACTYIAGKRRTLKAAIEEAKIAKEPKVPDKDGTFRSYFTRSKK